MGHHVHYCIADEHVRAITQEELEKEKAHCAAVGSSDLGAQRGVRNTCITNTHRTDSLGCELMWRCGSWAGPGSQLRGNKRAHEDRRGCFLCKAASRCDLFHSRFSDLSQSGRRRTGIIHHISCSSLFYSSVFTPSFTLLLFSLRPINLSLKGFDMQKSCSVAICCSVCCFEWDSLTNIELIVMKFNSGWTELTFVIYDYLSPSLGQFFNLSYCLFKTKHMHNKQTSPQP